MSSIIEISESVRHYYGQVLQSSNDLKTSACCSIDTIPAHLKTLIAALHPEVVERFYGCGSPLPPVLSGCTVLDLGCGSGRDCYLLSKLVGEEGHVIGVDMTPGAIGSCHSSPRLARRTFWLPKLQRGISVWSY
jgi:arsenite methyltransferase